MANQYAVKSDAQYVDKEKVHSKWQGKVCHLSDYYDLSGAIPDGDFIRFGKLPKGALILDAVIDFTDLDGSGGTIDLGHKAVLEAEQGLDDDEDGLLAAVDATSAGSVGQVEQANLVSRLKELSYESWVEAKCNLLDATTGKIKVTVFYAVGAN